MRAALLLVALLAGCGGAANSPAPAASTYPLDTCVVTGEKLGSMGEPVVYEYEGTEVRFCCGSCLKDFNRDPKKYMAMIAAAKSKK